MDISSIGKIIDEIPVEISYKIIQLFSAGLYSSPNKAFEELICNSYDAFADNVLVYLPYDLSADGAFVWVCDNGEGLDAQEMKNLWKIGESDKKNNVERDARRLQIGQFGIGKLATYILTRKLTYISKKNNRYLLVTMDYDEIHKDKGSKGITLNEREISQEEASQLLKKYLQPYNNGQTEFDLFGEKASTTWTISILTDLRAKATEISMGRLKWILRSALPLNPQFNLFLNAEKVESSKISNPILKKWDIGKDDLTAEATPGAACGRSQDGTYYVDFEKLKHVTGEFILYEDSLLNGKSAELGRSYGIFLNVRGRLINLDDPLLGMQPFTHGAFNRTRIIINADGLNENLASTREVIKDSEPYSQLKDYIKRKFNNEIRNYYFSEEERKNKEKSVSYRLSQTSYSTSKRPIFSFATKFFNGSIINPLLIKKPDIRNKEEILDSYRDDQETGKQIIETVEYSWLSTTQPMAILDLETRKLTINSAHPYIANYLMIYKDPFPLQSIAITEVLTEAYLYELDIEESIVNQIMRRRDITLKELALSDRESIPAAAMTLKDCETKPEGLEEAVRKALNALGFEAVKIGGKGHPDGKAEAILGYDENSRSKNYSLTYDAKSTKNENIAAATAHLSGLNRHKNDYQADFAIEVAPGFQGLDDTESAISKETRQQKITCITVKDFARLLFLAPIKQLGLDKLKDLFETCYTPLDVRNWIDELENKEIPKPPFFEIIQISYELQKTDREAPDISSIRLRLNDKLKTSYLKEEIKTYITTLQGIIPGAINIEGNIVNVQMKPDTINQRLAQAISTEVPQEWKALYNSIFNS